MILEFQKFSFNISFSLFQGFLIFIITVSKNKTNIYNGIQQKYQTLKFGSFAQEKKTKVASEMKTFSTTENWKVFSLNIVIFATNLESYYIVR